MSLNLIPGIKASVPDTNLTTRLLASAAERYIMKQYRFMAGAILFCSLLILTVAGDSAASVSATESDGYILTGLSLPGDTSIRPGTLSYWLYPTGSDCRKAEFIGWRAISPDSTGEITMKTSVPEGVTAGTYQIRVMHNQGYGKVSPCDNGAFAENSIRIQTPGKGGRDMSGSLSGGNTSGAGTWYRIESLSNIDTAVRVNPGETLSPVLTVTNTGADDTSSSPVEVHGYFGSHELVPTGATFEPLKSGESATVTPVFTIPEAIQLQGYPFFVILDPNGEHGQVSLDANLKRAPGQIGFNLEAPDIGCGCK
jgi:hypothetical protein